ncbi:MAG: hypothetical protein H6608_11220 [Flavobacteriales bacterium]|nr:hypothetical protein [Bacteroidota bacterium]MCB9241697.1 hypothetical protein [Flavobacteriales bacterium]
MMCRKTRIILVLAAAVGFTMSQSGCKRTEVSEPESKSAIQYYVNSGYSFINRTIVDGDGGFVMVGEAKGDAFISHINKDGDLDWERTIGGSNLDGFNGVYKISDGSYLAVGYTLSVEYSPQELKHGLISKFDANGNVLWTKSYGDEFEMWFYNLTELADKSLVVVGAVNNVNMSSQIYKLDPNGEEIWSRSREIGPWHDYAVGACEYDGNIVVMGMCSKSGFSSEVNQYHPYRIALEPRFGANRGETLFESMAMTASVEKVTIVGFDCQGTKLALATTYTEPTKKAGIRAMEWDMEGNVQLDTTLYGLGCSAGNGISYTQAGGLTITGQSIDLDYLTGAIMQTSKALLIELNDQGKVELSSFVGDEFNRYIALEARRVSDEVVVIGSNDAKDALMLMRYKLDQNGEIKLLKP